MKDNWGCTGDINCNCRKCREIRGEDIPDWPEDE